MIYIKCKCGDTVRSFRSNPPKSDILLIQWYEKKGYLIDSVSSPIVDHHLKDCPGSIQLDLFSKQVSLSI